MADWSQVADLLSSIVQDPSQETILQLCKLINKGKSEISSCFEEYEEYFSSLSALTAHVIALNVSRPECLPHAVETSGIIIKFCLDQLEKERVKLFSKKNVISILEGLCKGYGCLTNTEVSTFMTILKHAKYPPRSAKSHTNKDVKQTGVYKTFLETVYGQASPNPDLFAKYVMLESGQRVDVVDVKSFLSNENIAKLRGMHGGGVLLDLCCSLPTISQFMVLRGLDIHTPNMEIIGHLSETSIQTFPSSRANDLASELNLICSVMSLPVFEPLTSQKLNKITVLALSCVDIAMFAAAGKFDFVIPDKLKTDDIIKPIINITLSLIDTLSHFLATSHRAGGNVVQNFHLLICQLILQDLVTLVHLEAPSEMKHNEKQFRFQGFNILFVELVKKGISILTSLFDDLKLESGNQEIVVEIAATDVTINVHLSAWQRIKHLSNQVPFISFMNNLICHSFNKAHFLIQSTYQASTSSHNFEKPKDVDASSEDSTDSECMFGELFATEKQEETVSNEKTSSWKSTRSSLPMAEIYLEVAKEILAFITDYVFKNFKNEPKLVEIIQQSLETKHLSNLTKLLQDLDNGSFGLENMSGYHYFGQSLDSYLHVLLASPVLTGEQQATFLSQISRSSGTWPLFLGPRCLALVARILLKRQDVELLQGKDDSWCVNIWQQLIETLKVNVLKNNICSDINVDHLQLLLLIWHNFTKDQREQIFVLCVKAITVICHDETLPDKIPLYTYRLLLLLDYFLYEHDDDLPKTLMTQVEYNLFRAKQGSISSVYNEEEMLTEPRLLFFQCVEHEDQDFQQYQQVQVQTNGGPVSSISKRTPRFYGIRQQDGEQHLSMDTLKHLFSILEKNGLEYEDFYQSLKTLLSSGSNCGRLMRKKETKFNLSDSKVVRCMFGLCWRLITVLPPPITFLEELSEPQPSVLKITKDLSDLLLKLHWQICLIDPSYDTVIKDFITIQNMNTSETAVLISKISCYVANSAKILKEYVHYLQQISANFIQCDIKADCFPESMTSLAIDCIITRVYFLIRTSFTNEIKDDILGFLPSIIDFIKAYQTFAGFSILYHCNEEMQNDFATEYTYEERSSQDNLMFSKVIKIGSSIISKLPVSTLNVISELPCEIKKSIERWNSLAPSEFPHHFAAATTTTAAAAAATTTTAAAAAAAAAAAENPVLLNEGSSLTLVSSLISMHMRMMSFRFPFNLDASIRYIMCSLLHLTSSLISSTPNERDNFAKRLTDVVIPLIFDASFEYLSQQACAILECLYGSLENENYCSIHQGYMLQCCYDLIIDYSKAQHAVLNEEILVECERYMESLLDKTQGRETLQHFFQDNDKLLRLLFASTHPNFSLSYVHRMLKLMSRILELYEKYPNDIAILSMVQSLSAMNNVETICLTTWLSRIIIGEEADKEMTGKMADNRLLFQSITTSLEKSIISEEVTSVLLHCLLPLGDTLLALAFNHSLLIGSKFVDFLAVCSILADSDNGYSHLKLMENVVLWLQRCKEHMKPGRLTNGDKDNSLVQCTNVLLNHVADVLSVLKQSDRDENETVSPINGEYSYMSDPDSDDAGGDYEEESGAEESEDDGEGNQLWNKLCTFTKTRKEFANQHWYHCHTCHMNDGVGVCTICAKVCHKNHDVTYAKYGSFFCDCGAKEDDSCKAMTKRSAHEQIESEQRISNSNVSSRSQRPFDIAESTTTARETAQNKEKSTNPEIYQAVLKKKLKNYLEPNRDALKALITDHEMCQTILFLLNNLSDRFHDNVDNIRVIGGTRKRISKALDDLHSLEKTVVNNELLLFPTLGSQEGAFENVKLMCSGEQGHLIRQLLGSHVLRRISMCCLISTKGGKRQHLAVSHEKGKITILQLSSLLKQADSSRRKLTLTRLATSQVPFTILSLTGNCCNEDFLAVCGLKDCHVLTLNACGAVSNHLALHVQLESGNFIIKALWLPTSQTQLAIVTADFVKIYDLCQDALSPIYYFVLPTGKVRDVTFLVFSSVYYMAMMSSGGQVYVQILDESSSAKSGPFYLTNIINVHHKDLNDINGTIAGGGVSIYYSHTFQLLFLSYVQGKTFISPYSENSTTIDKLFSVNIKTTSANKTSSLCQWSELPQHPGLITCSTYTTSTPVVVMIKPDQILIQELKSGSSKSKIQDVVAIRHCLSNSDQLRTTVILLCEDGSLKLYMASHEHTGFWLSPTFQPVSAVAALKPIKQRKVKKHVRKSSSSPHFPIDFFEQCQILNDVEYGGKDLLEVYNVQQIKHRLMTAGMYVACTKSNSFSLSITNGNGSVVMLGIRVLVGCQALDKAPTYVEVFGRVIDIEIERNRWFDIPFTREEVLRTDRTITITFGQSHHSAAVTMIDSIKVYCKSKEIFGWPGDLQDEINHHVVTPSITPTSFPSNNEILVKSAPLTLREIMTANCLRALDGFVSLVDIDNANKEIVEAATSLLSSLLPQQVQEQAKILLASLHPSKMAYNNHKDQAQLSYVVNMLYNTAALPGSDIDPEIYEQIIVMARTIAINRPENLVKYTGELVGQRHDADESLHTKMTLVPFPEKIVSTFWKLYNNECGNTSMFSISNSGIRHTDITVFALVEILHAFVLTDQVYIPMITELYIQLLLNSDVAVSFSCKQALLYVLRPMSHHSTPVAPKTSSVKQEVGTAADGHDEVVDEDIGETSAGEQQVVATSTSSLAATSTLPAATNTLSSSSASRLESLLSGDFPAALYELPTGAADDEVMIELAIALSLQEQGGDDNSSTINLHHLLEETAQTTDEVLQVQEGEQSSSSASGHASDDDIMDQTSTLHVLRTATNSRQPIVINDGSETRAVSYGESQQETVVSATRKFEPAYLDQFAQDLFHEKIRRSNLLIIETFIEHFPKVTNISGVQTIPYMQVLLMLCSELNVTEQSHKLLDRLLTMCLEALNLEDLSDIAQRSNTHEVKLIIMRFMSVLMSKSKTTSSKLSLQFSISSYVASWLWKEKILDDCLNVLKRLMEHWQKLEKQTDGNVVIGTTSLLKVQVIQPPDMSPFFLKQYVKSHASDIFEAYPLLVTEMVLRLTYQVKKIVDNSSEVTSELPQPWLTCLFQYMMIQQTSFVKIRRQVRKLLLFLCGSKENYREQRDSHALHLHFEHIKRICRENGFDENSLVAINLEYEVLLNVIEDVKAAAEIASSRTKNWQMYCLRNKDTLSFLFKVSFLIDEGVTSAILQLLTTALCKNYPDYHVDTKEKKASEDVADTAMFKQLVQQMKGSVDIETVRQFVKCFLLQSNSTSIRWQAHSVLHAIHSNCNNVDRDEISDMMWSIWPELPGFGKKAAQFVDLLGYFTIKRTLNPEKTAEFSQKALNVLKKQNASLRNHPNSNVYRLLSGLVDFDGFYLESDPCLVCNNPELPYMNNKLSALKCDARFTTTCHMIKLVGSQEISRLSLRINDIKRQKMVKTINFYYNNRTVQSVVELKNKTSVWQKAKRCQLIQGQTELKIEFPLPIVACNLMIEYDDFYENVQASSETLQCPRCSTAVAASPGVCGNCGENVYQCHKCRSINYDEKDPFLCNACGFCKYAKFDVTLTAKPCCQVDPIENEEDRKKAVTSIDVLLERADKIYRQLVAHRQPLDALLMKIVDQGDNEILKDTAALQQQTTSAVPTTNTSTGYHAVHKTIQAIAQRYCIDCKSSFDELSKIIQNVLASRKELIEYDNRVRESSSKNLERNDRCLSRSLIATSNQSTVVAAGRCYGCSSAATQHCVTLLKALAMKTTTRDTLINEGLISELVNYTLYQGTSVIRNDVRDLLCLVTRENANATAKLNEILADRVSNGIIEQSINPTVLSRVTRHMQLLSKTIEMEDNCWEQRLRCVTELFLLSVKNVSPIVVQAVTLPCLVILSRFITPETPTSKANIGKSVKEITVSERNMEPMTNLEDWMKATFSSCYEEWQKRVFEKEKEKRWSSNELDEKWLNCVVFSPSCISLRQIACSLIEALCQIPGRKRRIMDLLTSYLQDVGTNGENAKEFFNLYFELMKPGKWKNYLASKGVLSKISQLIANEIAKLEELEEVTLTSDLSQGFSLKRLTEMMVSFFENDNIKQEFKGQLVGSVLNGYLSLRRLVVQRTKLIDQSQDLLLHLLGELTSGTESETREFISICVKTLNKYELDDLRTPVFIFERLCNIIYPEDNDIGDFLLTLEKDPQQEDFLQGRMQGNPYRSSDSGMGPLMRDIKNKICTDCDLIALLEDDTGMELLVNSKIISLDLPVKDVYKKISCPCQTEIGEPMKIVYRMRGLLGDATEDIIEHLDQNKENEVDNESVFRIANVMSKCGGLEALLTRLSSWNDLNRGHQLLAVVLKLLGFCVKLKENREYLAKPGLNTLRILLDVLYRLIHSEQDNSVTVGSMTEQILSIIEVLVQDVMKLVISGQESQLETLLEIIKTPYVRSNNTVLLSLMRILPFLTFGDEKSMNSLVDHFAPYLNFEKFDARHSEDEVLFIECFCNIADGIENNENGSQLKDIIIDKGIVEKAVQYLEFRTPQNSFSASTLLEIDVWKDFLSLPSLPYVLRFLSGMCKGHARSQLSVSHTTIPSIHRLEQVSSEEKVGSLAENLMEALKDHPEAKSKVNLVRRETRQEKKKLAMAMREKQLGALGMSATEGGKIITKPSPAIQGLDEISNETGLTCCICHEGYKFHPNKVLGIYTYTKRCVLDSFERKPRKTQGYTTVSHFNIVHYECHVAAVRLARGRDEWENAALQNSNTKCNGLLPIWGPRVSESAFASCLARHNNYIQESTGHLEPTFHNTVHDLRLLIERFAYEKSFNEDSGGGGCQSNFNIIPYMVHLALYVLNTTRLRSREQKSVETFITETSESWVTSSFELNGPLFMTVLSLFTLSQDQWKERRIHFLRRLIILAHVRSDKAKVSSKVIDNTLKSYEAYRPILIFFTLVDKLHGLLKQQSTQPSNFSYEMAVYIRNNDEEILKSLEELLNFYQNKLLRSTSFSQFCDVTGLCEELSDSRQFLEETLFLISK